LSVDEFSPPASNVDWVGDAVREFKSGYSGDFVAWVTIPDIWWDSAVGVDLLQAFTHCTHVIPEYYTLHSQMKLDPDFCYIADRLRYWKSLEPSILGNLLVGFSPWVPEDLREKLPYHFQGTQFLRDFVKWYAGRMNCYNATIPEDEVRSILSQTAGIGIWAGNYLDSLELEDINDVIGSLLLPRSP
jgi:hypothetical protein